MALHKAREAGEGSEGKRLKGWVLNQYPESSISETAS